MLTIGQRFEKRFEIIRPLGRGAFATVYLARNVHIDREVAIKVLDTEHHAARERFLREGRVLARLQSPYTSKLLSFGECDDGRPYIVFDYTPGQTIQALLDRHGALGVGQTMQLIEQVLCALAEAHALGVVHRDLKPSNIYVDHHGRVQVLDFGIAKIFDTGASLADLTLDGTVIGTPRYLAPEMLRGSAVTPAIDLYALGLCAYEMIFGEQANQGGSSEEVIETQLSSTYSFGAAVASSRTVAWLDSLVARDPADRPADATEALDRLLTTGDDTTDELRVVAPAAPTTPGRVPAPVAATAISDVDEPPLISLHTNDRQGLYAMVVQSEAWRNARSITAEQCCSALVDAFEPPMNLDLEAMRRAVGQALFSLNRVVFDANSPGATSATLIAVAGTDDDRRAFVAHVGWTTLFIARGDEIQRLTFPPPANVQVDRRRAGVNAIKRLLEQQPESDGKVFIDIASIRQALPRPLTSPTRGLGLMPEVRVELLEISLRPHDKLVLCSPSVLLALDRHPVVPVPEDVIAAFLDLEPRAIARGLIDLVKPPYTDAVATLVLAF